MPWRDSKKDSELKSRKNMLRFRKRNKLKMKSSHM